MAQPIDDPIIPSRTGHAAGGQPAENDRKHDDEK